MISNSKKTGLWFDSSLQRRLPWPKFFVVFASPSTYDRLFSHVSKLYPLIVLIFTFQRNHYSSTINQGAREIKRTTSSHNYDRIVIRSGDPQYMTSTVRMPCSVCYAEHWRRNRSASILYCAGGPIGSKKRWSVWRHHGHVALRSARHNSMTTKIFRYLISSSAEGTTYFSPYFSLSLEKMINIQHCCLRYWSSNGTNQRIIRTQRPVKTL
jgi:hypothetical protein